ncbi:MAG: LPS export ABC transporter periplasmic protein LptC [Holosporales bacterium]|jgi:hypothetical protein|nr:LPS export ABC transporter periplasmic protein LptC [Holosporales bacterium]
MDVKQERRHSSIVRNVGCGVALGMIGVMCFFIGLPIFKASFVASRPENLLPLSPAKGEENLTGLAMRGETSSGEPFFLFSDQTGMVNKLQYLEKPYIKVFMNKNLVRYWGQEGVFDPNASLLTLRKNVRALTESLLIAETEEAIIDAKNRKAWGNNPVKGFYTQSLLRGAGFRYDGVEERLYISGPVHITVY